MKKNLTVAALAVTIFLATGCEKVEVSKRKEVAVVQTTTTSDSGFHCPIFQNPELTNQGLVLRKNLGITNTQGTEKVLYLDFDGEYVAGTVWNTNGPYTFPSAGYTPDSINAVVSTLQKMLNPWNVKVTNSRAIYDAANPAERMMCILTPTSQYFGTNWTGIAYISSWYWVTNPATPFFVFTSNYTKMETVARGVVHEFGHTLGCYHQAQYDQNCNLVLEYLPMQEGYGELSWCTFMGNPFQGQLCTPFIGTPFIPGGNGCVQEQNDLSIFDQALGRRDDDIPDQNHAVLLSAGVQKTFITETFLDIDYFKVTSATPWVTIETNVDLRVQVFKGTEPNKFFPSTGKKLVFHIMVDNNPNTIYYIKISRAAAPSNNPRVECNIGSGVIKGTLNQPGY